MLIYTVKIGDTVIYCGISRMNAMRAYGKNKPNATLAKKYIG